MCFVWLLIVSNDDNICCYFVQVIPDQYIDAILQACYSDSYDKLEHTVKVGTVCGCDGVPFWSCHLLICNLRKHFISKKQVVMLEYILQSF